MGEVEVEGRRGNDVSDEGAEILLNPCATPEQGRRDEHCWALSKRGEGGEQGWERYYTGYGARLAVLKGRGSLRPEVVARSSRGPLGEGNLTGSRLHDAAWRAAEPPTWGEREREVSFVLLLLLCRCRSWRDGDAKTGLCCRRCALHFLAETCLSLSHREHVSWWRRISRNCSAGGSKQSWSRSLPSKASGQPDL